MSKHDLLAPDTIIPAKSWQDFATKTANILLQLRRIPTSFVSLLEERQLISLERICKEVNVEAEGIIMKEGDKPDFFVIVLHGKLAIMNFGQVLQVLEAGDIVGEMELCNTSGSEMRQYTVVAKEDTALAKLPYEEFTSFVESLGPKAAKRCSRHFAEYVLAKVVEAEDRVVVEDRHRLDTVGTKRRMAISAPCFEDMKLFADFQDGELGVLEDKPPPTEKGERADMNEQWREMKTTIQNAIERILFLSMSSPKLKERLLRCFTVVTKVYGEALYFKGDVITSFYIIFSGTIGEFGALVSDNGAPVPETPSSRRSANPAPSPAAASSRSTDVPSTGPGTLAREGSLKAARNVPQHLKRMESAKNVTAPKANLSKRMSMRRMGTSKKLTVDTRLPASPPPKAEESPPNARLPSSSWMGAAVDMRTSGTDAGDKVAGPATRTPSIRLPSAATDAASTWSAQDSDRSNVSRAMGMEGEPASTVRGKLKSEGTEQRLLGEAKYKRKARRKDSLMDCEKRLGPKEWFGEAALMTTTVADSTLRAMEDTTLLVLNRHKFLEVRLEVEQSDVRARQDLLRKTPFAPALSSEQIANLADACDVVVFNEGDRMASEADSYEDETFYLILEGTAEEQKKEDAKEDVPQRQFVAGDSMCEWALEYGSKVIDLNSVRLNPTIVATSRCTCLSLNRHIFSSLIGSYEAIMVELRKEEERVKRLKKSLNSRKAGTESSEVFSPSSSGSPRLSLARSPLQDRSPGPFKSSSPLGHKYLEDDTPPGSSEASAVRSRDSSPPGAAARETAGAARRTAAEPRSSRERDHPPRGARIRSSPAKGGAAAATTTSSKREKSSRAREPSKPTPDADTPESKQSQREQASTPRATSREGLDVAARDSRGMASAAAGERSKEAGGAAQQRAREEPQRDAREGKREGLARAKGAAERGTVGTPTASGRAGRAQQAGAEGRREADRSRGEDKDRRGRSVSDADRKTGEWPERRATYASSGGDMEVVHEESVEAHNKTSDDEGPPSDSDLPQSDPPLQRSLRPHDPEGSIDALVSHKKSTDVEEEAGSGPVPAAESSGEAAADGAAVQTSDTANQGLDEAAQAAQHEGEHADSERREGHEASGEGLSAGESAGDAVAGGGGESVMEQPEKHSEAEASPAVVHTEPVQREPDQQEQEAGQEAGQEEEEQQGSGLQRGSGGGERAEAARGPAERVESVESAVDAEAARDDGGGMEADDRVPAEGWRPERAVSEAAVAEDLTEEPEPTRMPEPSSAAPAGRDDGSQYVSAGFLSVLEDAAKKLQDGRTQEPGDALSSDEDEAGATRTRSLPRTPGGTLILNPVSWHNTPSFKSPGATPVPSTGHSRSQSRHESRGQSRGHSRGKGALLSPGEDELSRRSRAKTSHLMAEEGEFVIPAGVQQDELYASDDEEALEAPLPWPASPPPWGAAKGGTKLPSPARRAKTAEPLTELQPGLKKPLRGKTAFDMVIDKAREVPGPADYSEPRPKRKGWTFNVGRNKSQVDWLQERAARMPGPADYHVAPEEMPLPSGGRISRSITPSMFGRGTLPPGPAHYVIPSLAQRPSVRISNAPRHTSLDAHAQAAASFPGPGQYEFDVDEDEVVSRTRRAVSQQYASRDRLRSRKAAERRLEEEPLRLSSGVELSEHSVAARALRLSSTWYGDLPSSTELCFELRSRVPIQRAYLEQGIELS